MRKASIGIFATITVILFFLSTSMSVTAQNHSEVIVDLESYVSASSPRAEVSITPHNVWSYSGWAWIVDVNDGDDIEIRTYCVWENTQPGTGNTGRHTFTVSADYNDPPIYDNDYDDIVQSTGEDGTGSDYIVVPFTNVQEGAQIDLIWYVEAKNFETTPYTIDWDQQTGMITLI